VSVFPLAHPGQGVFPFLPGHEPDPAMGGCDTLPAAVLPGESWEENPVNLTMRNLSLVFAAGCWGALWNGLAVWLGGYLGIAPALGVHIAPPLTPAFLYAKLVWGGIWGLLFLLPMGRWSFPARGLLFSLVPTLAQLFWVFPFKAHKGFFGLQLGAFTPVFVLFYNAIWGYAAGLWLNRTAINKRGKGG
jgi:hypothetical protein